MSIDHGIHVGGTVNKESAEAVSTGIVYILRAGFESHADQETIRAALDSFQRMAAVENVTISGCNVTGKEVNT